MSEILCSTGALIGEPNGKDYRLIAPLAEQLTCDGLEFMMYSLWYDNVDALVEELTQSGLSFPVAHCEKRVGQAISEGKEDEVMHKFSVNCEVAKGLGAEKLVLHLWDGMVSDTRFSNNLKMFGKISKMAESYGLDLLVENIVCVEKNPMVRWCELVNQYPEIHFIYDTKMAAFHNQMDWLYQKEYQWLWQDNHIRHFHINDYNGGYMEWSQLKTLPIGEGWIDFEKLFAWSKKYSYDGTYTVEATAFDKTGEVNVAMLNRCFAKIRELLGEETGA